VNSSTVQMELTNWSVFESSQRKFRAISLSNNEYGEAPFFSHAVQYDNHQAGPFSPGNIGVAVSFTTPGTKIFKVIVKFDDATIDSTFFKVNMVFSPPNIQSGSFTQVNPMLAKGTGRATLIPVLDINKLTNGGTNLSGSVPSKPGIISDVKQGVKGAVIRQAAGGASLGPITDETWTITSTIQFQGYDNGNYELAPSSGTGKASIYYATGNTTKSLKKPVILINGFDPVGKRTNDSIYIKQSAYTDSKNAPRNLADDLRTQGYDLIILTFPGFVYESRVGGSRASNPYISFAHGADYIERNAFVLYDLIQKCNATLKTNGSNEKLVIVGPSMGGLISKYCLSYMEKHNVDHNTRLWVSFDSPHQGANLPIGDQFFVDYAAHNLNKVAAKASRDNQISSPAAQEMLVDYYAYHTTNAPQPSPYRTKFLQALADVGDFPKNVRNVAISNGSINGTKQPSLGACDLLFDFYTTLNKHYLCFFSRCLVNSRVDLFHGIVHTEGVSGTSCNVFHGVQFAGLAKADRYVSNTGPTSYDNCPGGSTDINKIIVTGATGSPLASGSKTPYFPPNTFWSSNLSNHTFIPTTSALNVSGSNDLGEDLSSKNLVCLQRSPFRAYYAPLINEPHVTVTAGNVAFLMQELRQDTLGTTGIGVYGNTLAAGDGGYKITGPTSVCQSFSGTYSVSSPSTMIVNWTTSADLKVLSGNGTNSITVGSTSSAASSSFIQASIIGTCGSYSVKNSLTQPGFTAINTQTTACNGTYQGWSLNAVPNVTYATNWQWTVDNPAALQCYFSSPNQPSTNADVSGGGGVTVTYTDSCGGVHKDGVTIYSNCGATSSATIFPNPSSSVINVDFNTTPNQPTTSVLKTRSLAAVAIPESVKMFSNSSTVPIITISKRAIRAHNNVAVFNVEGLTPGLYYVHILFKDHKESQIVRIY